MFEAGELWPPIRLTLILATVTTIVLLIVATPIAWWLARSLARWKEAVAAIVALPLVLPPTVLGFYLLLALGPNGPGGWFARLFDGRSLAFTFEGLVIGGAKSAIAEGFHYPDNLDVGPGIGPAPDTQPSPDRTSVAKVALCEALIDNDGPEAELLNIMSIPFSEIASADESRAQSLEESRAHRIEMNAAIGHHARPGLDRQVRVPAPSG